MLDAVAKAAGSVLAGVFGTAARLRPTIKPLHPRGHVSPGTLTRHGLMPPVGVRWLDEAGANQVLVRSSKAVGTPGHLPDIHGLAIRVQLDDGRFGDLLFATTGTRPVLRHLLRPTTSVHEPMTTLLPYRSPSGPILLGAFPSEDERSLELRCARPTGPWRRFATMQVDETLDPQGPDSDIRFDPVTHPLPGLALYGWVNRLRQPAYLAARRNSPTTPPPT